MPSGLNHKAHAEWTKTHIEEFRLPSSLVFVTTLVYYTFGILFGIIINNHLIKICNPIRDPAEIESNQIHNPAMDC